MDRKCRPIGAWSRVLLEKLTVVQVARPSFMEPWGPTLCMPLVSVLGQMNPVYPLTLQVSNIRFNIIPISTHVSQLVSPFRFSK
jgi:hypothetical protein